MPSKKISFASNDHIMTNQTVQLQTRIDTHKLYFSLLDSTYVQASLFWTVSVLSVFSLLDCVCSKWDQARPHWSTSTAQSTT